MPLIRRLTQVPRFVLECWRALLRDNRSALAAHLRGRRFGGGCFIDTGVVVQNPRSFAAGPGSALYHGVYLLNDHGLVTLGKQSHLGAYCYVNALHGKVTIGDFVAIGPGTKIFSYSNHYAPQTHVTDQRITSDVVVGDNVFIGANCCLLPGTVIGSNVIVAAGSVVKGRLESEGIYGGVPCRKLREGWYSAVENRAVPELEPVSRSSGRGD
jgi:acetyltransferase-like isoleucine patch superfamily enzyme